MPINITWLCIVIPIAIIVVVAILGAWSKLQNARRIRGDQAGGVLAGLNTPEKKARFRLLAAIALIGLLGMIVSIVMVKFLQARNADHYFGIPLIAVAIIFGIIASIAGFLLQREIDRRL